MSPGLWKVRGERTGPVECRRVCVRVRGGGSQLPLRIRPQSCGDSPLPDLLLLRVAKVRLGVAPAMFQWDLKPQARVKGR